MLIVSDTSAISNLALIGLLSSLREQFGKVVMPEAVARELTAVSDASASKMVQDALGLGWLETVNLTDEERVLADSLRLDRGESEAIALAKTRSAELLCIDEAAGRTVALELNLNVKGVLGILLDEKTAGRIAQIRPLLDKLQKDCGFFISAALKARVLGLAGE